MYKEGGPAEEGGPTGAEERDGEPILRFGVQADWDSWLAANHERSEGVWLKIAKRGAAERSVSYAEAVGSALCFGWIDARKGSYDESHYLQRFTPRRPRSIWSRVNREKALELIAAGRMRPAGVRAVDAARANGRWESAYEPASTASVPEDFQALLDAKPAAGAFFATLTGTNRYAILHRIQTAKRPETRAKRMAKFITMLERHETIYPISGSG